jgi:hypothetical protein
MKINVLTLWDSDNYGAYLQAFALKTFLTKKGCNVSFYDFTKKKRRPLPFVTRKIKLIPYFYRLHKGYINAQKQFDLCPQNDVCNGIIIGSDEVWNVNNFSFVHFPEYLGYGFETNKIITYAVSCNGSERKDFEKVYSGLDLSHIAKLSARDDSTLNLIHEFKQNGKKVLDPTFLIDDYSDFEVDLGIREYILIYGYNFSKEEILKIQQVAQNISLKTVSCGAFLDWTDVRIAATPFEFLSLMKNAKFVITSTFHGSVFALIYRKQFISVCRDNKKVQELLKTFALEERDVTNEKKYDHVLENTINYSLVEKTLCALKMESISYLEDFLLEVSNDTNNVR